jgi:hypothetical protein
MSDESTSACFECKRPLVEIDNRGQRLRGCMTCNIWRSLTGGGAVKLSVEDLAALHALRRKDPVMRELAPEELAEYKMLYQEHFEQVLRTGRLLAEEGVSPKFLEEDAKATQSFSRLVEMKKRLSL